VSKFIHSEAGRSNLVLTMPHSAVRMPEGFQQHLRLDDEEVVKTLNSGIDLCVPNVTGFHDYQSASRVWTDIPRAVLDVNRIPCVEQDPHGIIWMATLADSTEKIRPMLTQPYAKDEFEALLGVGYHPFVAAVKSAMQVAKSRHGIAINFDLHSMPASLPRHVTEGPYKNAYLRGSRAERGPQSKSKLPDLLLLDKGPVVCSQGISDLILKIFESKGFLIERGRVRPSGAAPTANMIYGDPPNGMHSISIEIVGRTFEPLRGQGMIKYNPKGEKEMREAFYAVFKALESLSPNSA